MGSGRHFLQIPGPTNVPDRILHAIARPTIDHRGPEFRLLCRQVLAGLARVLKTGAPVIVFPASGTGAWHAALVNTLSAGDAVLIAETGHFSSLWAEMAGRLGLRVEVLPGHWGSPVDTAALQARLADDGGNTIKAVCIVHNETSTGVTSDVVAARDALDATGHGALLMVDTISSLASMDYRHDEWGVDVTVGGSQKGLMLPPGLGFNVAGPRALAARAAASLPQGYWDWLPMIAANADGLFPSTPATNLLFGLAEALDMLLEEEGLDQVFARHARLAAATRAAVRAWGLELLCRDPAAASNSLTAVVVPDGHDADAIRALILERFDMSLGNGLGKLAGRVFRIGHLGDFNELMLAGTLAGVEMGLRLSGLHNVGGGVDAALRVLSSDLKAQTQ